MTIAFFASSMLALAISATCILASALGLASAVFWVPVGISFLGLGGAAAAMADRYV